MCIYACVYVCVCVCIKREILYSDTLKHTNTQALTHSLTHSLTPSLNYQHTHTHADSLTHSFPPHPHTHTCKHSRFFDTVVCSMCSLFSRVFCFHACFFFIPCVICFKHTHGNMHSVFGLHASYILMRILLCHVFCCICFYYDMCERFMFDLFPRVFCFHVRFVFMYLIVFETQPQAGEFVANIVDMEVC